MLLIKHVKFIYSKNYMYLLFFPQTIILRKTFYLILKKGLFVHSDRACSSAAQQSSLR